jgi:dGTPase
MLKTLAELYSEEDSKLALYAVKNSGSGLRVFQEEEHPYRLPFNRDRDRIYHSRAFKRLEYKTQVFINSEVGHFRTRLTHTLEVAGVSRSVAAALGLNDHLAECIALAHDLGHAPFGHAGQDILQDLMRAHGGFEHNKQSLRIVQKLENRYPDFSGLNLCLETLRGIMKHGGDYEDSDLKDLRFQKGPSLESLITDHSDEIAYNSHDIEDGLEKGYINAEGLLEVEIWKENFLLVREKYPSVHPELILRKTVHAILNNMATDLIVNTNNNLEEYRITDETSLQKSWENRKDIVSYSQSMYKKVMQLKSYLYENLYSHPLVLSMSQKGQSIIEKLFFYFTKNPEKIAESYRKRIPEEGVYRCVADYISGMTDRYAELKLNEIL